VPTRPTDAQSLLAALAASDPGRPRITVYDDTEGPTRGERVELSARVVANWVAKAANLLQDELDAGPGTVVRLGLPPHWRTVYWAVAAWSVGATVELRPAGTADVVVTDDPGATGEAPSAVLVTLAALARSAPAPVPPGVVDEARELATHGDVFTPYDSPDPDDAALVTDAGTTSYADLVPDDGSPGRWHSAGEDAAAFLRLVLAAWAADGSVVLTRGTPAADVLERRLASEGVTATA
jgi:uncharacterized protein (TIGR03089 family)